MQSEESNLKESRRDNVLVSINHYQDFKKDVIGCR